MTDTLMTVTVKRSPAGLMAMLKGKCIARYKLHTVPGRPEELQLNGGDLVISFGYLHGSVRIRQHGGERNRQWVDYADITFRDGWLGTAFEYLDPFFGYTDPFAPPRVQPQDDLAKDAPLVIHVNTPAPHIEVLLDPSKIVDLTRPIRDNPQA
jgi:hypothetical protein